MLSSPRRRGRVPAYTSVESIHGGQLVVELEIEPVEILRDTFGVGRLVKVPKGRAEQWSVDHLTSPWTLAELYCAVYPASTGKATPVT